MFNVELYEYEELRPVCSRCGNIITDESGFYLGNEWYCKSCVEVSEVFFSEEVV